MPIENKSKITIARAILIHSIIRGEDVRVKEIIADNIAMIAQGMQGKSNLAFPSTIFKLQGCRDLVEMCKCSSTMKKGKKTNQCLNMREAMKKNTKQGQHQHFQAQFHQDAGFQQHYMEHQQQGFTLLNEQLASMQIQQQTFF
ncbi:hypothetical protein PIB30_069245 [Stylosanthes scabra]|uniref:Uncharacterized protein n=1 Tax=Stylosanthes scabra TaxID=79078 RepID=A0ABU6XPG5_9FABA|nr:hypothetical protein [Stylosanthes scabra]